MTPFVQRRKVWLTPTTRVPCSNSAKTRNPLKLAGVPQTNETISAVRRPKFTILQGHVGEILLFNMFFRLSIDACLSCEYIARQSCAMVTKWRIFSDFWSCISSEVRAAHFQTCILNLHKGHTMCGSMVDIQSLTAEIRRGKKKKKERKIEEPQHENIMVCPITYRATIMK